MNSFKFRYFSYHKKYQRPFSARKLLATMKSKYIEDKNNNNDLNINTIRSLQLSQDFKSNKKIKKIIISKDLEKEINENSLKEILPLMLTYNNYLPNDINIENEKINNNDNYNDIKCSNIISCFQLLLKFLFEKKNENENYNTMLQNQISSLNQESNLIKYNELIQKNREKINKLQQQKIKLKSILINNGKKVPSQLDKKLYICDICQNDNNKFSSYRAFHRHYVQNHINPYSFNNNGINLNYELGFNNNLDNDYLDTKMNGLLQRVMTTMKNKNIILEKEKKKGGANIGVEKGMLKSGRNFRGSEIKNRKMDKIMERIEKIENNQKEFEKLFKSKVDNFLKELKSEIEKLNEK